MSEKILPGRGDKLRRTINSGRTIQIDFRNLANPCMHEVMLTCFAGMNKRYNQKKEYRRNHEYFRFAARACILCLDRLHRCVGYDVYTRQSQSTRKRIKYTCRCFACCRSALDLGGRWTRIYP